MPTLTSAVRLGRGLAAVVAAGLALSACGSSSSGSGAGGGDTSSSPTRGGTLNVLRYDPFEGFNLDKESLNSTYQLSEAVLEPLIRVSDDGKSLEPGIASSWKENPKGTSLTLTLDPHATFSDGKPVTPADVAFSVDTWKSGANYGPVYSVIKKTKVLGADQIKLTLAYPDTALPDFLSWATAGVVPKDFDGMSATAFWQKPVGAGPFSVSSWSANGKVVLKRNAHYYRQGQPYVDGVVSTYAADTNSIALQLRSGQADLADELPALVATQLSKGMVQAAPKHLTYVMVMNTAKPGLTDPRVRRAIGYSIDYGAIAKTGLKGYATTPQGALPINSANWAPPSKPYFTKNAADATAALQGASLPSTLTLTYPNDASNSIMAQIIQGNLQSLGIKVTLHAQDAASNYASISSGDYDLGLFAYNAISPDVSDPVSYLAATGAMFTTKDTKVMNDELTAYGASNDATVKQAAITKVQDDLMQNAPFLALAHASELEGVASGVHGVTVSPWGTYPLDKVWKSR